MLSVGGSIVSFSVGVLSVAMLFIAALLVKSTFRSGFSFSGKVDSSSGNCVVNGTVELASFAGPWVVSWVLSSVFGTAVAFIFLKALRVLSNPF